MPRTTRPVAGQEATRLVQTGDARIAYQVLGDGDVDVIVLQPFWSAIEDAVRDPRTFIHQLSRSFRVIVHDRRGTGRSERNIERISTEAMVEDVLAVMTHAGVHSAVIAGMGESAPLALRIAAQAPERVARVVLVDPALRPIKGPGSTMLLHTLTSRPRAGLRALARTIVDDDIHAAELGTLMARTVDGQTAARLYEAYLDADALAVLDEVAAPVLLAYGVYDRLISDDEARGIHASLRNSRLGIVNGPAGGEATVREAWVQMRDFLAEQAPRGRAAPAAPRNGDVPEPAPAAVPARSRARAARAPAPALVDYVPSVPPPRHVPPPPSSDVVSPAAAAVPAAAAGIMQTGMMKGLAGAHPVVLTWGPPPDIPEEAVRLNRQAIDQLLMGEIEEALALFQQAIEIAPHYEDATINHRELLSRLVQRRVAEWQARQAEEIMADSERRAHRLAQRQQGRRRRPFGWLLRAGKEPA